MRRSSPRTIETALNLELARQLRNRHPRWLETYQGVDAVAAEQTGTLGGGSSRLRPDIVIRHHGGLPVVVESEFTPARGVEQDAINRLGKPLGGQEVESVIALRLPQELAASQVNLGNAITKTQFEYCLFKKNRLLTDRWPTRGWISGGIDQLAEAIEHAALSETRLSEAADALQDGIETGAQYLLSHRPAHPANFINIARELHQEDNPQTTRMAVAIIANAFVFQNALASNYTDIPYAENLKGEFGIYHRVDVISCWSRILNINYWPVFGLAVKLLSAIAPIIAPRFLKILVDLATRLSGLGAASLHDLSGQMFQRLISDRKFLATFYTRPSSAALLAELAMCRLNLNWADIETVGKLQIADLACGTGSLLTASQQAVARRFRRAGGDDRTLHSHMMEKVLIAADIMPAATHLTASAISSAHPGQTFEHTRIYTMPYGAVNGEIRIGSLDLTRADEIDSIFSTAEDAPARIGGTGAPESRLAVVERESCDLVIMNPPFTRPNNHEATDARVPSFAGFGTSSDDQSAMAARLTQIRNGLVRLSRSSANGDNTEPFPAGVGNAGLASNFIDLAHAKLKPNGCLALILPASFMQGHSWLNARTLLAQFYRNIMVVSISATSAQDRAFSADTNIAEVLIVAERRDRLDESLAEEEVFAISLRRRPTTQFEGAVVASAIEKARNGSKSSGRLAYGDGVEHVGSFLLASPSTAYQSSGVRELGLIDSLAHLSNSRLRLPQTRDSIEIPQVPLGELGEKGAYHLTIRGGGEQGSFDIYPLEPGEHPEYPALWRHHADRERRLIVEPDKRAHIREGCKERALTLWQNTASRLHFNMDFRLNSQSLAACITRRQCIGGTAWPNFLPNQVEWEIPLLLWANTTFGLMSFWQLGARQQQGRSRITISRLPDLLTLDMRQLSADQLLQLTEIYNRFSDQKFLPANEAYQDSTRKSLDAAMLVELLGLDNDVLNGLAILREQWCREPSVHGGKSTRPKD